MWPKLTETELLDGVQMALAAIMNQSQRVGRKLHKWEIRWVVRAGYAYLCRGKYPLKEAHHRADLVLESMIEAAPAANELREQIEKAKDNSMDMDSDAERYLEEGVDFTTPLEMKEVERRTILAALARTGGNITQAQKELGMGRTTMYRRLRKYGVIKDGE